MFQYQAEVRLWTTSAISDLHLYSTTLLTQVAILLGETHFIEGGSEGSVLPAGEKL